MKRVKKANANPKRLRDEEVSRLDSWVNVNKHIGR